MDDAVTNVKNNVQKRFHTSCYLVSGVTIGLSCIPSKNDAL